MLQSKTIKWLQKVAYIRYLKGETGGGVRWGASLVSQATM